MWCSDTRIAAPTPTSLRRNCTVPKGLLLPITLKEASLYLCLLFLTVDSQTKEGSRRSRRWRAEQHSSKHGEDKWWQMQVDSEVMIWLDKNETAKPAPCPFRVSAIAPCLLDTVLGTLPPPRLTFKKGAFGSKYAFTPDNAAAEDDVSTVSLQVLYIEVVGYIPFSSLSWFDNLSLCS